MECYFDEDFKYGKQGEIFVLDFLIANGFNARLNPNKYGPDIICEELGFVEVKRKRRDSYLTIIEPFHDIHIKRLGWGYNKDTIKSDIIVGYSDESHIFTVFKTDELLSEGYKQICERLNKPIIPDYKKRFIEALDKRILNINKPTRNRKNPNQSAWFTVRNFKGIPLDKFIRGFKLESNNSWGCLGIDKGY